jgi:hypothetical protein
MKIGKIKIVVLFLLAFGLQIIHAQEAVIATGGDVTGFGGTVAYSVGQVVYTTNTGANTSVAQGVQQPYEISSAQVIEDNYIKLDLTAYPNPTANSLTLNVTGNTELSTLSFHIYDNSGRLIISRNILSSTETINMENLPRAMYFLKVTNKNKEIKTFKIIKN